MRIVLSRRKTMGEVWLLLGEFGGATGLAYVKGTGGGVAGAIKN